MGRFGNRTVHLAAGLVAIMATFGADINAAAQVNSCTRLQNALRSLERGAEFRALATNTQAAREVAENLQGAESAFVRAGCQDQLNAGQVLDAQCQGYARAITSLRANQADLARAIGAGQAVAAQREQLLQDIARFNCGTGAAPAPNQPQQQRPRSVIEEMFTVPPEEGALDPSLQQEGVIVEAEPETPYQNMSTLRSVCVRTCDGYYWPVSFSTVSSYLGQDAAQCTQQCPGAEVSLYYYSNPGQTPEQMVDLHGRPYSDLPTAFRYREELDPGCSCRQQQSYGIVTIAGNPDLPGQSRAVIEFGELEFPLPRRDPRRTVEATVLEIDAVFVDVPLPRPRPDIEGVGPTVVRASGEAPGERIIEFGDRRVRVVGPETPYARLTEEAS